MTRFWPDGLPIQVTPDQLAAPAQIVWRRRRLAVARIVKRWRVDDHWWEARIWREYFQLITDSGLLLLVYHDVRRGQWRLQRVYD